MEPRPIRPLSSISSLIVAFWVGVAPARAAIEVACSWPPAGGPTVAPESTGVIMTPVVADLDNDDTPEILIVTFDDSADANGGQDGVLRILSGRDCSEIVSIVDVGCRTPVGGTTCSSLDERAEQGFLCPGCGLAVGDIDGDGAMDIVGVTEGRPGGLMRRVVALERDGTFKWWSEATNTTLDRIGTPTLADLDGDGQVEILVRAFAFNADGTLRWDFDLESGFGSAGVTVAADLDGDGKLEVIPGGFRGYRADGSRYWQTAPFIGSFPAIADFDLDCHPEIVLVVRSGETVLIHDQPGFRIRCQARLPDDDAPDLCNLCQPTPTPGCDFGQGGPPVLADIDGDDIPEIGVAGGAFYTMFKYVPGPPEALVPLWSRRTNDCSSRNTGSTMFDLEFDGRVEVLYNDEERFRIWDALTGTELYSIENTSGTLVEMPVVADVDGEGNAKVVLAANDYASPGQAGVRVLRDPSVTWTGARRIWNQHAYHGTNVRPTGAIPRIEPNSWEVFNTYRVQVPIGASLPPVQTCGPRCTVDAAVGTCAQAVIDSASYSCTVPAALAYSWTTTRTDVALAPSSGTIPQGVLAGPLDPVTATLDPATPPCDVVASVTLTLTDPRGRRTTCGATVTFDDDEPPSLVGVPPDATAPCDAVPPPGSPAADDNCDVTLSLVTTRADGPCEDTYTLTRTWTAADACGNAERRSQVVTVRDVVPPALTGCPADVTVTCDGVPPAAQPAAADACDPDPDVTFVEQRVDGGCPDSYVLVRRWTAADRCGNVGTCAQRVTVRDVTPPVLVGCPADVTIACTDVAPVPAVTESDACDPDPDVAFAEQRVDGGCTGNYRLIRTWTATDRCGNAAPCTQVVTVRDTTPPRITAGAGDLACLWPPNHWYVCLGRGDVSPVITDDCSEPVTWRFTGCASDQCDEAPCPEHPGENGDGNFTRDCVVLAPDGEGFCVRAERAGTDPDGRRYGVAIVAADACGNQSEPVVIGHVHVPHDQSPHARPCLDPTRDGERTLDDARARRAPVRSPARPARGGGRARR